MSDQRVVFDTSTLVSAALRPDSIPHRALLRAVGYFNVCVSKATLEELREVLTRDKFSRYLNEDTRKQFIRLIEDNARLFIVHELDSPAVDPRCRDPKDNKFLALAAECDADILVSNDEDLLVLHRWNEVRIVRPAEFLLEGE
jgi:putative PIN family toxin of toxin-antitoxin system